MIFTLNLPLLIINGAHQRELSLFLLAGWTGQQRVLAHAWMGDLYVCQEEEWLVISRLDDRGCLGKAIVHQARSAEEIATWLLERGYLQICCFCRDPGVCGLYKRVEDASL